MSFCVIQWLLDQLCESIVRDFGAKVPISCLETAAQSLFAIAFEAVCHCLVISISSLDFGC